MRHRGMRTAHASHALDPRRGCFVDGPLGCLCGRVRDPVSRGSTTLRASPFPSDASLSSDFAARQPSEGLHRTLSPVFRSESTRGAVSVAFRDGPERIADPR